MNNKDISTFYEDLPNNLPDNSTKAREEKKQAATRDGQRVEKVVRGKVKTKKNELRKWTDIFISEDAGSVGNYILMDVLVPTFKKTLYDIVVNSVDIALFGGRGGGGNSKRSTHDKISFRDYNGISRREERSYSSTAKGAGYQDIVYETRADARDVLESMEEVLETYDTVSVMDMYDLSGLTCDHTLNNYGWDSIRNAKIVPVSDGYIIKMPRATYIRR